MRLGIHLPHIGQKAGPDAIRDAVTHAGYNRPTIGRTRAGQGAALLP